MYEMRTKFGLVNEQMSDTQKSIVCPKCNYKSYHPKDVEFEFCAHCDEFHDGCKRGYGGVKIPKPTAVNKKDEL
jgi:hypothetical protein